MKQRMQGFTLLELTLMLVVMGCLTSIALDKFPDSNEAELASAVDLNHGAVLVSYSRLIADGMAQMPMAPYPDLRSLAAESGAPGARLALDSSGVCVGGSYKLATYSDANKRRATMSPSDPVRSVALDITKDFDYCP